MSELGDLISVGLLAERDGLGLTSNEAHAIAERIASHLDPIKVPVALDSTVETWALEFPGALSDNALDVIHKQLVDFMPGKHVVVVQEGAHFRALETLDAAWAEVEAALPEQDGVKELRIIIWADDGSVELSAAVGPPTGVVLARGTNLAVALRFLADGLREMKR